MTDLTVHSPWLMMGDCLERMQEIPAGSVDMVLCDLPYGTTRCAWDSIIPFEPLWAQYRRVVKSDGAIVLFAAQPFTSALVMSQLKLFRYDLVWDKVGTTGFLNAKRMPLRRHESVLVFYAKQPTYNPRMVERGTVRRKGGGRVCKGVYGAVKDQVTCDNLYHPTSIIQISNAVKVGKSHATQKPVELMERLIESYTNLEEVVLDNCAGSFSTGVACVKTKRRFIGIEKDEAYFKIGRRRVEEAIANAARPASRGLFDDVAAE